MTLNHIIKEQLRTDRNPLMPMCCDKVLFRQYIEELGLQCIPLADPDDKSYVAKASNDSGSACIVVNGVTRSGSYYRLIKHMTKDYGVDKGEWFYGGIPFAIIKEKYMGDLVDYKFHCMNGKPAVCQVIGDRQTRTSECLYTPSGVLLNYRLDTKFNHKTHPLPDNYKEMLEVARGLSAPFKYVRVDLYSIDGEIYVGELTFAPRGGKYTGIGQKKVGKLLCQI